MDDKIEIKALEVKEIEEDKQFYKLVLKDSAKESKVIQATISKLLPLTITNNPSTQTTVIGKVPAEKANLYNALVHPFGLPSKEVEGEDDALSDSTGDPYTEFQSVLQEREDVICPIQIGDLLIVEIDHK